MSQEPYIKTIKEVTTTIVDKETGEVVDEEVKKVRYLANNKEDFFLCYSAILGIFERMTQAEIRIFGYCLRYVKGLKFDISKKVRLSMAKEIDINERTILNTLPSLVNKGLLVQHPDDMYQVNPRYAFQGGTGSRDQQLQALIELRCIQTFEENKTPTVQ